MGLEVGGRMKYLEMGLISKVAHGGGCLWGFGHFSLLWEE